MLELHVLVLLQTVCPCDKEAVPAAASLHLLSIYFPGGGEAACVGSLDLYDWLALALTLPSIIDHIISTLEQRPNLWNRTDT